MANVKLGSSSTRRKDALPPEVGLDGHLRDLNPARRDHLPGHRQDPLAVIEVDQLTKRFGPTTAVDDLSFAFRPCRLALATKQFPGHEG